MDVMDKIAPVKEVRVKQRTEPWMSSEILHMISERDAALGTSLNQHLGQITSRTKYKQ